MSPDHRAEPGAVLADCVSRLVAVSVRHRAAWAARLGVHPTDLLALSGLARAGTLGPGELARALALSSGGASAVIARLVGAGLIERHPGATNQRHVVLRLTAKARAMSMLTLEGHVTDIAATAASSPDERAAIERFLSRLVDAVDHEADAVQVALRRARVGDLPSPPRWS
jgi:DNA-binding MarR family transcriptional regulator